MSKNRPAGGAGRPAGGRLCLLYASLVKTKPSRPASFLVFAKEPVFDKEEAGRPEGWRPAGRRRPSLQRLPCLPCPRAGLPCPAALPARLLVTFRCPALFHQPQHCLYRLPWPASPPPASPACHWRCPARLPGQVSLHITAPYIYRGAGTVGQGTAGICIFPGLFRGGRACKACMRMQLDRMQLDLQRARTSVSARV